MSAAYEDILISFDRHVVTIATDRPKTLNALCGQTLDEREATGGLESLEFRIDCWR